MCSTLLLAKSAQVPNAQAWYTKKLGLRVWAHATVLLCLLPFSINIVRLRRKKENNVIEKIKVVISNCCSGKGSRLWDTILGYVAAWGWKQSVRSQPVWRRMKKKQANCVCSACSACVWKYLEIQSCLAAICFLFFACQVKLRFYKTLYATICIPICSYM